MVYAVCKMQWNNLLNIVEYLKTSWFSARAEWTEGTNRSKCKSVNMHKYEICLQFPPVYIASQKRIAEEPGVNQLWRNGDTAKQLVFGQTEVAAFSGHLWPLGSLACARDLRLAVPHW